MDYLTKRFDMIAERILENERLTADLDDDAAQVLLDWGLSSAKLIVDSTAGIEDEEEADEAMYTRLRANARLMRAVNKWVPKRQTMDELASLQEFGKVGQYVETVYAETFIAPSKAEWQAFLSSYQANSDVEIIVNLRNLFYRSARSLPADEPTQSEASSSDDPSRSSPPNPPERTEAWPERSRRVVTTKQEPTPTDETPSEQVSSQEPSSDDFSRSSPPNPPKTTEVVTTIEKDDPNVYSDEPTQTDETASEQVPTTDEPSNNNLSEQVPTRDPQKKINPNLQDNKPKSLVRKLWNWTTSFFRR